MTPDRKAPERVWVDLEEMIAYPEWAHNEEHHVPYTPESLLLSSQARVEELEKELTEAQKRVEDFKAVKLQVSDCMEFLLWLKGYEYIDGPIEDRLESLALDLRRAALRVGSEGGKK